MITLATVNWGSAPAIPITLGYEKKRSGGDMQYRVTVTVSPVTGSSFFGYPIYFSWALDGSYVAGTTLKEAEPSRWSSAITYTTDWYTVANKTTGTTALSVNLYSGWGSSRNEQYTYCMQVDPAASVISVSDGTLGTAATISLTRYDSAFKDTVRYTCGSATGTVASGVSANTLTWDTAGGNTVALSAQNTAGKSVSVTFTVETYAGSTLVGSNSVTASFAIPSSVKPSVALSVTDAAGYYATYGAFVQGKSKLTITATPTLAYGAAIKAYQITADGKTYSESPVTTEAVQGKGDLTVTAKITDTRGRASSKKSTNITVLAYAKPSVQAIAYRCDSAGTADPEGAYMRVGFTAEIAPLNSKNSASYTLSYTGGKLTGTGTSFTSQPISCDVSKTFTVTVKVTDDLSATTATATVPIAFTLMDYHNSGQGVAFGKVATRAGLDCAMDAYFGGEVKVKETLLLDLIYPVGSIYMSTKNVSPKSFFGGSWSRIKDVFLLAAGTYAAGATGGEETHTLTLSEMPSHSHDINMTAEAVLEHGSGYYRSSSSGTTAATGHIAAAGGGNAHNNMPPYLAVYVWKRTA